MNAEFSVFFICVEAIKYLLLYNLHNCTFNAIPNRVFLELLTYGEGGKETLPHHIYPTMTKLATVMPYLKKIQKVYESRDTHPEFY